MPEPIPVGGYVRVLPPFDKQYPGIYLVLGHNDDASAYTLEGIGDFDAKFIEAVTP